MSRFGEDGISLGQELNGLEGNIFSTILADPPWRIVRNPRNGEMKKLTHHKYWS